MYIFFDFSAGLGINRLVSVKKEAETGCPARLFCLPAEAFRGERLLLRWERSGPGAGSGRKIAENRPGKSVLSEVGRAVHLCTVNVGKGMTPHGI